MRLWIGLGLLGAVGCGDDSRLHAEFQRSPTISPTMLTMTVQDGRQEWTWTGADFVVSSGHPNGPITFDHVTSSSGTLKVNYRLDDGTGVISDGSVDIPLRHDWHYTVYLTHTTYDPTFEGYGDLGRKRFNLAPAYQTVDRQFIWITWYGQRSGGGVY